MKQTHEKALIKKLPVVLLHGWKLRGEKYLGLKKLLEENGHIVLIPDMPGFGSTPVTSPSMMLADYVAFVHQLLEKSHIEHAILIGHSFGGRVALKYAAEYPEQVDLLVLTGVPVIRHLSPKKRIAQMVAFAGRLPLLLLPKNMQVLLKKMLYRTIGEWDYYKAGDLQTIFKNIVTEDLVQYAKKIKTPTLLVWGGIDSFMPIKDVDIIKTYMPQAKKIVFPKLGHNLPYADPQLFFQAIKKYI